MGIVMCVNTCFFYFFVSYLIPHKTSDMAPQKNRSDMLYNYNNNRCTLHIKMTFGHRHAYFQIGDESIDLNFKNVIFICSLHLLLYSCFKHQVNHE